MPVGEVICKCMKRSPQDALSSFVRAMKRVMKVQKMPYSIVRAPGKSGSGTGAA